jgi:hypothetical protein
MLFYLKKNINKDIHTCTLIRIHTCIPINIQTKIMRLIINYNPHNLYFNIKTIMYILFLYTVIIYILILSKYNANRNIFDEYIYQIMICACLLLYTLYFHINYLCIQRLVIIIYVKKRNKREKYI